MNKIQFICFGCIFLGALAVAPAFADKPAGAETDKRDTAKKRASDAKSRRDAAKAPEKIEFFGDRHRLVVADFYNDQIRSGNCPLGFSKREDGCVPPAQSRQWALGKPLPKNAVRFDVPAPVVAKLGKPPSGHRYVRVSTDILLVSNRTGMVVDGIQDLGRK